MSERNEKPPMILIIVGILLAAIRFVNVGLVPIFIDEAIYLEYGDKIVHDPQALFLSITNANIYPLFPWILALVNFLTGHFINLLYSGRVIALMTDVFSSFLVFLIGKKIFTKKFGLLAAIIYLSLPLNFFHGRLVLLESVTNVFILSAVYFSVDLAIKNKIKILNQLALVLSMILAFLTKPLAVPSFVSLFFIPFFLPFKKEKIFKFYLPLLLGIILILLLFLPAKSQFFYYVNVGASPNLQMLSNFKFNLWKAWWWLGTYLTMPVIIATVISSLMALIFRERKVFWIISWFVTILFLSAFFSKLFFPRHLFPLAAPTSFIIAYGISRISKSMSILFYPLALVILLLPWLHDYWLLTNPYKALSLEDKQAFYEDSFSGVGLDKMALKLRQLSQRQKIDLFTENEALTNWTLLNIYDIGKTKLHPDNNLVAVDDFKRNKFYENLQKMNFQNDVYILLNDHPYVPKNWSVILVAAYAKGPNRTVNLYQYLK